MQQGKLFVIIFVSVFEKLFFYYVRVCAFAGDYYCDSCMDGRDFHYIPSKILYNWDFNRYPVSKWAAKFLFDTEFVRFYDLEVSS